MLKKQALPIALAGFVVGLVFGLTLPSPHSAPSSPALASLAVLSVPTADFVIDFGDGELRIARDQTFDTGATLFDLTQKITAKQKLKFIYDPPGTWGVFVKEIDNRKNGKDGKFWQYWVNAEQIQVAADKYILQPNDVVEWKFIKSQPGQ